MPKKIIGFTIVLCFILVNHIVFAGASVCHIPSGNPSNSKTITVGSQKSVNAHLAHGDTLGECSPSSTPTPTEPPSQTEPSPTDTPVPTETEPPPTDTPVPTETEPSPTDTPVPASVDLVVTVTQTTPLPGPYPLEDSTYTITVSNVSSVSATGVTVAHSIPTVLNDVSTLPSLGSYDVVGTWTIGTLAAGATETMTVTGAPNTNSGSTYTPTATASSIETEATPANNTGSTSITVQIIVNTLADNGTGGCTRTECTLREALAMADSLAGADVINFSVSGTIDLVQGPFVALWFQSELTINGSGITLKVSTNGRPIRVFPTGNVTMNGVTVTGGNALSVDHGGGIYVDQGTLTLNNVTVRDNISPYFNGGGIYNDKGTLNVNDSLIMNNIAGGAGDGIYNNGGTVTITNTTFDSNNGDHCAGSLMTGSSNTLINPASDPQCP